MKTLGSPQILLVQKLLIKLFLKISFQVSFQLGNALYINYFYKLACISNCSRQLGQNPFFGI